MNEKNNYKSMTPASGEWYFVGKPSDGSPGNSRALIFPVAMWAETHEGYVVGLVGDTTAKTDDGYNRLVGTPKMEGAYTKINSYNQDRFNKYFSGGYVEFSDLVK